MLNFYLSFGLYILSQFQGFFAGRFVFGEIETKKFIRPFAALVDVKVKARVAVGQFPLSQFDSHCLSPENKKAPSEGIG